MGITQDKQGSDAGPAGYLVDIGAGPAIASGLGLALLVTCLFLREHASVRPLRPLAAMGTMTLTLYSVHLLALIPEEPYGEPVTLRCCPDAALIGTK